VGQLSRSRKAVERVIGGIGFVLTEHDPFTLIDIDDCVNPQTGEERLREAELKDDLTWLVRAQNWLDREVVWGWVPTDEKIHQLKEGIETLFVRLESGAGSLQKLARDISLELSALGHEAEGACLATKVDLPRAIYKLVRISLEIQKISQDLKGRLLLWLQDKIKVGEVTNVEKDDSDYTTFVGCPASSS